MTLSKSFLFLFFLFLCNNVESTSLLERSYEYVVNLGKNLAPSFMSILNCMGEENAWDCARERAGSILDSWGNDVQTQRRKWQEAADAEVRTSGRSFEELPSKIGSEVEGSLNSIAEALHQSMARALSRKHEHGGGIDSITISTGEKKKMKKKKTKPPKIHLLHPVMMPMRKAHKQEKGRAFPSGRQTWVIGDNDNVNVNDDSGVNEHDTNDSVDATRDDDIGHARGVFGDMWAVGEKALDAVAEHAVDSENIDNGIVDKSSFAEQRGKKKKKKKAILKLLILGAVLKAKIGTLLQILSFKLQVKFFIIAVLGLAINLARLWIDIKNKNSQQPQKVIYYEHAQHQHHYDHEEEPGWGGGPWSRMYPEEDTEIEADIQNTPYRGQERNHHMSRV